ncbi:serine/arginine repetitive matrix protein 4 isoform X2 [Tetranychus urticae]|uniref:serine/arginine repetitive matrix protein 4 isoform X2 n=1 Tax=Tetranychus urticae TaxID=32264 RepID=UPI00077BE412|nr:serine/arginine repetitive matrix protein 4 isoform X2 [Tetranychus urticae]
MCSQACLQEMEKFWKDSIRSLLVAALSSQHHGKCPVSEVSDEPNQATSSSTIASPSSSTPSSSLSTNTSVNITPGGSKHESSTFSLSPLSTTSQIAMNNSTSLTPMVEMTASLLSDIISNLSVLKSNQSSQQQNQAQSNTKGKVKRKRRRKRYTLAQKQRFLQQSVWSSTENNDGQLRVQSVLSFQETHKMSMLNQEENLKLRNNSINKPLTPRIGYLSIDGELKDDSDVGQMTDPLCKNSLPSTTHGSKMQSTEPWSSISVNDADIHNDDGNGSFDKSSAKLEEKSLRMEQIGSIKRRLSSDEYLDGNNPDHFVRNNYNSDKDESSQLNKEKKRNEKLCANHDKSSPLETTKLESHVKHSNILASFAPSKSLSSSSLSPKNGYLSEGSDKELIRDDSRKTDNKLKQTKNHGLSRWDDSSSKDSNKHSYLVSGSKNVNTKDKVDVIQSSNGIAKRLIQEKSISINLQSIDSKRFSSSENDHISRDTGLQRNDNKSCDQSERRKRSHSKASKSAISPNRSYKSRRDEVRNCGKDRKISAGRSEDRKQDSSRSQSRSRSRSKSSSRSRSRSRNRSQHRERSRERRRTERKHRHGPSSSGYRGNKDKTKDKISSRSRSKSQTKRSSSRNKRDKSSNGRSHHRSRKHSRRRGHSSHSSSAYSTSSRSSSASSFSRSSSSSDSSRFSSLISRSSRGSKSRSKSRSPSIRRRGGSPNFLERRRITSARKRPTPYHRDSPSPDSSSSESPITKCKRTLSQRSCSSSSSTSSPCYYYLRKSRSPSL